MGCQVRWAMLISITVVRVEDDPNSVSYACLQAERLNGITEAKKKERTHCDSPASGGSPLHQLWVWGTSL